MRWAPGGLDSQLTENIDIGFILGIETLIYIHRNIDIYIYKHVLIYIGTLIFFITWSWTAKNVAFQYHFYDHFSYAIRNRNNIKILWKTTTETTLKYFEKTMNIASKFHVCILYTFREISRERALRLVWVGSGRAGSSI